MKTTKLSLFFLSSLTAISSFGASQEPVDTVTSTPGYEMLDEIVIEAEKPVMQTDGAKLTYNVDEDPAASSSAAIDILKKVPQVSVDGDGNIRLNGSTDFKLQVNGLENPMLKQYAKQIFESMPANMIVKIEVITEPGAKEDAEGLAGIINIITERIPQKGQAGYSGSASLRVDNRSLTPSLYGLFKKDNFMLSANINYQWSFRPQRFEQQMTSRYLTPDNPGTLETNVGQRVRHQYLGGSLNMSWEPNSDNLFTAGADVFFVDGNISRIYGSTEWLPGISSLGAWGFSQEGTGAMKIFNISANASYRHNFGYDGNRLVLSYLFNFGRNDIWIGREYMDLVNYLEQYPYQRQDTKTFNRGHTVQADYANDFHSEHHLLEVGAKGIFRHNTALAGYLYGNDAASAQNFPWLDSNIMQPQNIYAAYASYTGSFDCFGLVAGLRYEHTLMGITNRKDSREDFRNRLNDWVPNAALTWNFTPSSNLRLAYQMRISRPSIEQVNPFELSFTPYQINTGNPDLTSERTHIVSLKYSSFGRAVGGSVGIEYNRADNAISSFTYLREQDGVSTIVTSFANIGKRQDFALTALFTWGITRGMNLAFNGRVAYNQLRAPAEGLRRHGWSGNIGANWNYSVADVYKFSAYGFWNSRSLNIQGYSSGYYYYGISASRDFLADRSLTLSVSANNFLQKRISYKSYTETPQVVYDNVARNLEAWNVGISLTWKFGSLKAQVKNTGVEVTNDDINKSSNSSQGSGL